jgi:hypothetical protein
MDEEGAVIMKTFMPVIEWVAEACQMLHPQSGSPFCQADGASDSGCRAKGGPVQGKSSFNGNAR